MPPRWPFRRERQGDVDHRQARCPTGARGRRARCVEAIGGAPRVADVARLAGAAASARADRPATGGPSRARPRRRAASAPPPSSTAKPLVSGAMSATSVCGSAENVAAADAGRERVQRVLEVVAVHACARRNRSARRRGRATRFQRTKCAASSANKLMRSARVFRRCAGFVVRRRARARIARRTRAESCAARRRRRARVVPRARRR